MTFESYIALGDSMSIDSYPCEDARSRGLKLSTNALGAASLLFENDDELYPEFAGRDLKSLHPGIKFANYSQDGATTAFMLKEGALNCLTDFAESGLITLTLGGNDLLLIFEKIGPSDTRALNREVQEICTRYLRIVKAIKAKAPAAKIILSTVYDPTDGTGIMPSKNFGGGKLPLEYLSTLNRFIESCAVREKLIFADVYRHFFGHGAECGSKDNFWYFPLSPIEPSCRGASEIRAVWLMGMEKAAGAKT